MTFLSWLRYPTRVSTPVFGNDFLVALRALVGIHHSIYRRLPPQGIYFEALVQEAFTQIRKPFSFIEQGIRNSPGHDLIVEGVKLSLKTETGIGTHSQKICITKLCTTERDPWTPITLKARVIEHLNRYDSILMLRAVWNLPCIHYQLLEIPIPLLRRIEAADLIPVGKRSGRQSLGADVVFDDGSKAFHVHFDGSDGKCQVRDMDIAHCSSLLNWQLRLLES